MKELFRTTFKNGLTAAVSFDAENMDYSYMVTCELVGEHCEVENTFKTNSPTAAFAMLAEIQRMVV